MENEDNMVLCAANSYNEKYFFNKHFDLIPEDMKEELQNTGSDYVKAAELTEKTEAEEKNLETLYKRWEELSLLNEE